MAEAENCSIFGDEDEEHTAMFYRTKNSRIKSSQHPLPDQKGDGFAESHLGCSSPSSV